MNYFWYCEVANGWALYDTVSTDIIKDGLTKEAAQNLAEIWNECADYLNGDSPA